MQDADDVVKIVLINWKATETAGGHMAQHVGQRSVMRNGLQAIARSHHLMHAPLRKIEHPQQ